MSELSTFCHSKLFYMTWVHKLLNPPPHHMFLQPVLCCVGSNDHTWLGISCLPWSWRNAWIIELLKFELLIQETILEHMSRKCWEYLWYLQKPLMLKAMIIVKFGHHISGAGPNFKHSVKLGDPLRLPRFLMLRWILDLCSLQIWVQECSVTKHISFPASCLLQTISLEESALGTLDLTFKSEEDAQKEEENLTRSFHHPCLIIIIPCHDF